jgi:hypothetical protein
MSMSGGGYPVSEARSGRATTALILGLAGFLCCQLVAPVAWYLGAAERKAIREGLSPAGGSGLATAGMVLGIIGTILFVLAIIGTGLAFLLGFGGTLLGVLTSR